MAKRLTDKQKKKIIADYVECGNYSEVARRHKVSDYTVKNIINADLETLRKLEHKKEENTKSVLEHMDNRADDVKSLIDRYMLEFMDEDKIKSLPLNQLSTVFGTIIDKFTMKERLGIEKEIENRKKLDDLRQLFKAVNNVK